MMDRARGYLEVGLNERNEIVVNHPDLKPDENGVGHIIFSVDQARHFARNIEDKATKAEAAIRQQEADARQKAAEAVPVDRSSATLTDGSPITPDHRELKENGQQKGYIVLSDEERAKGFVRPVRDTYRHGRCGATTTMGRSIAETYARCPTFYGGTYCCRCGTHFDLVIDGQPQFFWDDGSAVGS